MRQLLEALYVFVSLLKTNAQIVKGMLKVAKLQQPRVTIFGGHLLSTDSPYAEQAHILATNLINENISIITGGGPGVMEAAHCGASHYDPKKIKARSLGITVKGLEPLEFNYYAKDRLIVDYFYARKWLLINYSDAFVIFPGGFGTLDELCEALMLMQVKKLKIHPIVLIGKDYWHPLLEWFEKYALKERLILLQDYKLIQITDSVEHAFNIIVKHSSIRSEKKEPL